MHSRIRKTELCVRRRIVFRSRRFFFGGDFNHRSRHASPNSLLRRTLTSLAVQGRSKYSIVSSGATVTLQAIISRWTSWNNFSAEIVSRCRSVSTATTPRTT